MKFLFSTLLTILFCSIAITSYSQAVAPFQLDDEHALELDDITMSQIQTTLWHCEDRFVMEKNNYWNRTIPFSLKFLDDKTFSMSDNRNRTFKGDYEIVDNAVIKFNVPEELERDYAGMVQGGYTVYKVTDKTLVLSKILTSTHDNAHLFRFVTDEYYEFLHQNMNNKNYSTPDEKPNNYVVEKPAPSEEQTRQSLLKRIRGVAKGKKIEITEAIEEMSIDELNTYLRNIYGDK